MRRIVCTYAFACLPFYCRLHFRPPTPVPIVRVVRLSSLSFGSFRFLPIFVSLDRQPVPALILPHRNLLPVFIHTKIYLTRYFMCCLSTAESTTKTKPDTLTHTRRVLLTHSLTHSIADKVDFNNNIRRVSSFYVQLEPLISFWSFVTKRRSAAGSKGKHRLFKR